MGVKANLRAKGDWGKDASAGLEECGVGDRAAEACDKVGGVVVEFFDSGDGGEDVDVV